MASPAVVRAVKPSARAIISAPQVAKLSQPTARLFSSSSKRVSLPSSSPVRSSHRQFRANFSTSKITQAPVGARLEGRTAIITGSSAGIGRAIALAYAREGANVVCSDLQAGGGKELATHEQIKSNGGKALFVKANVAETEDVKNLVAKAVAEYGRLDIMVNNAGVLPEAKNPKSVHELDEKVFDQTMSINTRGVFLGNKYAIQQFLKQEPQPSGDRGWIINLSSILAFVHFPKVFSYCASKGAVQQMTRQVAVDYAPHRIHVNSVNPGFTESAMIESLTDDPEAGKKLSDSHPFRGLGHPEDIANAAVFLGSDDASWVTGIALPVEGGYLAK
ncbi:MAG: hypothetical protein M1819_006389 [Sarea resinae]|nr:MAG: hypothetical protein M1819_006389 [Sarea resinae]